MHMDWDLGFSTNSPEFLLLEKLKPVDMEEFRSEKTVKGGKSPEEIAKLAVDESLSEMDRAYQLISSGQEVQKVFVIESLPGLLKRNQMETLCRIVPKICDTLSPPSPTIHAAASKAFGEVAQAELVPVHIFTSSFLPSLLTHIDSKDPATSQVWLEALLSAIPLLTRDVINRSVLSIAVAKGQLSQSVASRQASCRIIGAISSKFEPFWLKRELLPMATTLCQDVDQDVRRCMCHQLSPIARALGLELAKNSILPELFELSSDEECGVRVAAMEALTDLLSFLDPPTLSSSIIPLLQKFCDQALSSGDSTLTSVARLLGEQCHKLQGVMAEEQRTWFVKFYRKLSQYSRADGNQTSSSISLILPSEDTEAECRQLCAYNLPAMVLFTGPSSFHKDLFSVLSSLVADDCPRVRRAVAAGFHEVVKILGDDCSKVSSLYQSLLRDSSPDVLMALMEHLPCVLGAIASASHLAPETRQPGLLEFITPLLASEVLSSSCRQWRLHKQLLDSWSSLHCFLTSDQIYNKFVPVLFRNVTGPYVLPVRLAAGRTLCTLIRRNRKADQRSELCARIIEECGQNSSCRQRLLFIEICQFFMDTFSRSFFKEHFFDAILKLAQDPIVNIRLRLCRLLPSLKATLKLPGDRVLLQQLEMTVRKLISQERDTDAIQAVREAVTELDRIEVAMGTLSRRTFFEADLADEYREKEERALVLAEERDRERELKEEGKKSGKKGKVGACKNSSDTRKSSLPLVSTSATNSPKIIGDVRKGSIPHVTTSASNSPTVPRKSLVPAKSKTPNAVRRTISSPMPPVQAKSKTPTAPRRTFSPEASDNPDQRVRAGSGSSISSSRAAKLAIASCQKGDKKSPSSSPGSSHSSRASSEKSPAGSNSSSKPPTSKSTETPSQRSLKSGAKKKGSATVYANAKSRRT